MAVLRPIPDDELDRLVLAVERLFEAAVTKAFTAATEKLFRTAKAMTAAGIEPWVSVDDAGVATTIWQQEVPELSAQVQAVYTRSGEAVAATLSARAGVGAIPVSAYDVLNQHAVDHLAQVRNRLTRFGDAAWGDIRGQLVEGFQAGEGIEPMTARLRGVADMSRNRARLIARTEVVSASNAGAMAGASSLPAGLQPVTKRWLATRDARTRATHVAANGQVVPFDGKFAVGGVMMSYPGESGAPAAEVINCRCTVTFGDDPPTTERSPSAPAPTGVGERRFRAAEQWGVSPAQVKASEPDVRHYRARVRAEAAQAQADSFRWLDSFDGHKIKRPPRAGSFRGGEYDWVERLHKQERTRLSRWFSDDAGDAPDVLLFRAQSAGVVRDSMQIDEFMEQWLYHSRRVELAGALRAGRLPSLDRFGGLGGSDVITGFADEGIDVWRILNADLEDAAGYLAKIESERYVEQAYRVLGPAARADVPPWRMSFQSWEAEVRDLEQAIVEQGQLTAAQRARYNELVPPDIDTGQDFEGLYAEIVETARIADVAVADWAVIPWTV